MAQTAFTGETAPVTGTSAQITPFLFETHTVRVVMRGGEPWFVASDVCDALGYEHIPHAMRMLDDDEKGVHILDTLGGQQKASVISESGLFTLVLRSRKPEARKFFKWVTGKVLPSIRKTGSYGPAPAMPALPEPADIDVRALLLSGQSEPVALTPAQQALIDARAWALAREAYELSRQHLARRVAYRSRPAHRNDPASTQVADIVSSTTLGNALAHEHYTQIEQLLSTARVFKDLAGNTFAALQALAEKQAGQGTAGNPSNRDI